MASAIEHQLSVRLQIWLSIISLLVFPAHLLSLEDQPHPPSSVPSCINELVLISPCLPFISEPPNNPTDTVPSKCCDAFSSLLDSGDGICLCYLVREPQILGFPLNGNSKLPPLRSTNFPGDKQSADQDPEKSSPPTSTAPSTSSIESSNKSPPSFKGEKISAISFIILFFLLISMHL